MTYAEIAAAIGRNVKSARTFVEITQATLARITDLTVVYISHIETGRTVPAITTLKRIADALNTSVSDLLKGV